jgi:spermidine/putrescine transport system ATP-binding protein
MVLDPAVLLLDEPLGALDLKLREHMKIELKQLQHEFGTTFVYITHDQSEAMMMSDRVAVMNAGRFEQVGTPEELYFRPQTAFVAGFVGDANKLRAKVIAADGAGCKLATDQGLTLIAAPPRSGAAEVGGMFDIFIRPETIAVGAAAQDSTNRLEAVIEDVLFNGAQSRILARLPGGDVIEALLPQSGEAAPLRRGASVALGLGPGSIVSFAAAGV